MIALEAVLGVGSKLIDRLLPDENAKAAARLELMKMAQEGELRELTARAEIIAAEAKSESWLAQSWRPITMLVFTALIVARWLGWSAPGIGEAEVLQLWRIVELGLGGYVIGRTAEKIAPTIAGALRK